MPRKPKPTPAPEPMPVGGYLRSGGRVAFDVPETPDAVRVALAEALDAGTRATEAHGGTGARPLDADERAARVKDAAGKIRAALAAFPPSAFSPFLAPLALDLAGGLVGGDPTAQALAVCEAERFARELAEAEDGPLVRAAVGHAAYAFLVFHATAAQHGARLAGRHTTDTATHWERRLTAAQTRYLRALATVAGLRRLATPTRRASMPDAGDGRSPYAGFSLPDGLAAFLPAPSGDSLPAAEDVELAAAL